MGVYYDAKPRIHRKRDTRKIWKKWHQKVGELINGKSIAGDISEYYYFLLLLLWDEG